MVIIDKIKSILNDIDSIKSIIYDSGFSSNVRIDRSVDPIAILYLLTDWYLNISTGLQKEQADIEVFFCKRAKLDQKGEEKDIIVNECAEIAKEFIARVLEDKSIEVLDDSINMRSSYGRFDSFAVGVSVKIRLAEKQGTCIEVPEPTPEPNEDNTQNEG